MKRILILLIGIVGLALPAWFIFNIINAPNEFKEVLSDVPCSDIDSTSIVLTIISDSQYHINGNKVKFSSIQQEIDSLVISGYDDSVIVVEAYPTVKVEDAVKVMNLIAERDRLISLRMK